MDEKSVEYDRPDGQRTPGFLSEPEVSANAPAVIVIQEWWGLNDQIRGIARRLSQRGYRALVPDLYRGKIAANQDEAKHLAAELEWDEALLDIRGAIPYLQSYSSPAVGLVGFCMGGTLALLAASKAFGLNAAVCCYGPLPDAAELERIRIPVQCHYGNRDTAIRPEQVNALEKILLRAGIGHELFRYEAGHGFMNETRTQQYDAASADLAWKRMMDFFDQRLRVPE